LHLCGIPKWFVERNANIDFRHLNNEIGSVIEYDQLKPICEVLPSVAPELFQQIVWVYQKAYELVGVSEMAAQSKKPQGLDSAPAQREFEDITATRFQIEGQRFDEACMEATKQMVEIARDIAEDPEGGGYEVKSPNKRFFDSIDFADVDLGEEDMLLQIFPTSSLPSTPAGKKATIQEYIQMGWITPPQGLRMMDLPDTDGFYSLETAAIEDIERTIEKVIEDGEYVSPDGLQDLSAGIRMMTFAYLKYKGEGVPEDNLAVARQWIDDANRMLMPPEPPPSPEQLTATSPLPGMTAPPSVPGMTGIPGSVATGNVPPNPGTLQ